MKNQRTKQPVKLPTYPGGKEALNHFIKTHLKYPEAARKKGVAGTVLVAYDVAATGNVLRAKVEKGIGYGCDEEALRVVKLLQYNKVNNRGIRLSAHYKIKIRFAFDKEKKQPAATQTVVTYSVTNEKTGTDSDNNSYNYSVEI